MSAAQILKRRVESATDADFKILLEEYSRIYGYLILAYDTCVVLLPSPSSLRKIDDIKYAMEQMVNFLSAEAISTFPELINLMKDLIVLGAGNPLTPLMPILNEWKMSVNWAVGASALTLIEVMVNKKLEELRLSREGSFEKRVRRLSENAKQKGVQLPDLLASPFYEARNKVVHEGKEPSPEELKIILNYLAIYSSSLKNI